MIIDTCIAEGKAEFWLRHVENWRYTEGIFLNKQYFDEVVVLGNKKALKDSRTVYVITCTTEQPNDSSLIYTSFNTYFNQSTHLRVRHCHLYCFQHFTGFTPCFVISISFFFFASATYTSLNLLFIDRLG